MIDLIDVNSENVVFFTDSRSVLDSLARYGEHNLRRKLYSILEHRRVVLQWIPAHCGIKGNEHADMEQEKLPITLKQKKTIMKNMFRAKKIPDDYHRPPFQLHTSIYLKQHTGPLDVSRESGAPAGQVEETPGRASLEKLGCRTPPQLHAGGVGR